MLKAYSLIRAISLSILPYIIIFALYIQFNGESSPGGGFQAGVIFASISLSYFLVNSYSVGQLPSLQFLIVSAALGLLFYIAIGLLTIGYGGNFLAYHVLPVKVAQARAIFAVELAIGISVAAALTLICLLLISASVTQQRN